MVPASPKRTTPRDGRDWASGRPARGSKPCTVLTTSLSSKVFPDAGHACVCKYPFASSRVYPFVTPRRWNPASDPMTDGQNPPTMRVVIADDEPLARKKLRILLASEDGVEIVAECKNGKQTIAALQTY